MIRDKAVDQSLRLAVFGWVQEGAGSVASAFYNLCRALLDAGHEIDFFADPSFIPDPGYGTSHFAYIPITVNLSHDVDQRWFPDSARVLIERLGGRRRTVDYKKRALSVARSRHIDRPYDAVLFLGTPPGAPIRGVPTVVWPQSAPHNELHAVRGLSGPVSRVSGRSAYLRLRLYYEVKDHLVWGWARSHHLVLASELGRQKALRFGVPANRICVAPYPVDLVRFSPAPIPADPVRRILCIGRLDPRKRVDLLLDAVAALAARRGGFQVEVVGRDGYIKGWSSFVQGAGRVLPVTYTEAVPQSEILARLHAADVVVQPSEHEEFGHAVAEALACGVPVVTGPTNGTGEYAPTAGSCQFDRHDPLSVADAIERALTLSRDPAARAANRKAARVFAAERVASRLVDFIHRASEEMPTVKDHASPPRSARAWPESRDGAVASQPIRKSAPGP